MYALWGWYPAGAKPTAQTAVSCPTTGPKPLHPAGMSMTAKGRYLSRCAEGRKSPSTTPPEKMRNWVPKTMSFYKISTFLMLGTLGVQPTCAADAYVARCFQGELAESGRMPTAVFDLTEPIRKWQLAHRYTAQIEKPQTCLYARFMALLLAARFMIFFLLLRRIFYV